MIILYTSNWCGYCNAAKNLLRTLHLDFKEINIENENISREELMNLSGGYTVPQIFIDDKCIGGYDQLMKLFQDNKLPGIHNG